MKTSPTTDPTTTIAPYLSGIFRTLTAFYITLSIVVELSIVGIHAGASANAKIGASGVSARHSPDFPLLLGGKFSELGASGTAASKVAKWTGGTAYRYDALGGGDGGGVVGIDTVDLAHAEVLFYVLLLLTHLIIRPLHVHSSAEQLDTFTYA